MIELLAMRHAKSDWGVAAADRERPLAPRGVKAAKRMGRALTRIGAEPELMLTSPAVRARATAELAAAAGGWQAAIRVVPGFYGGAWSDVTAGIAAARPSVQRIMVIGHEPTWSDLVAALCGGGRVTMPTGAVACLRIDDTDWTALGPGCAELRWHLTPATLRSLL